MFLKRVNRLELTIDELLTYLKKSPETKALVLGELESMPETGKTTGYKGSNEYSAKNDNIILSRNNKPKPVQGTSPTYITKRLKRDNPELFSQVTSGELSPHAAAVRAGIRKPMVQTWIYFEGEGDGKP